MDSIQVHEVKGKFVGAGAKACARCGQTKPFDAFYIRSGYGTAPCPAIQPGHFLTECKACMKVRAKEQTRLPLWESKVPSEHIAIEYLMSLGIPAMVGKSSGTADVDLVAWGCVWIEVKLARIAARGNTQSFVFDLTKKQIERGFLAHVVHLICAWGDDVYTHHFVKPNAQWWYHQDNSRKSAVTYTVGRNHIAPQSRFIPHQLMQADMDAAQDRVELLYGALGRISAALQSGQRPTLGVPFARE